MARRSPSQYSWGKLRFDEQLMRKHYTPQSSKDVRFIVAHHMTIVGNGRGSALDACYRVWQTRKASAQYGVDGKYVRQFVWDKDYAWAAGSAYGNRYGIHIEHANSTAGPRWLVAAKTWKTGARLVGQLHHTYKLGRPVKDKTIRKHSSFYPTACPGPYLGRLIWNAYVKEAQRVYDSIAAGGSGAKHKKKKEVDDMPTVKQFWEADLIPSPTKSNSKNKYWRVSSAISTMVASAYRQEKALDAIQKDMSELVKLMKEQAKK